MKSLIQHVRTAFLVTFAQQISFLSVDHDNHLFTMDVWT